MKVNPRQETVQKVQQRLLKWGKSHFQDFPWRNPRRLWYGLIGEMLLQRTRAENVVPVYQAFFEEYPTLEALAEATVGEVEDVIYPLGLKWRAPFIKQLGEKLNEKGRVPLAKDKLLELPGVGPYTAAAWLSFHGGKRGVLIDANVVRWLARMVGRDYDGETRRKRWMKDLADTVTPESEVRDFNYAVLDFTMTVCTSRSPSCGDCPLGPSLCKYGHERTQ